MKKLTTISFLCQIIFSPLSLVFAQPANLSGQLSAYAGVDPDSSFEIRTGILYIPTLSAEKSLTDDEIIDVEASLNAYGTLETDFDDAETDAEIKPYRLWTRFSSSQFEVRLGLQKINFGSATLMRPLMWFDRIDARDPLGLTEGVYALLARYYFLNNANIWGWGLYGNDDTKGWESYPSDENTLEYGSRIQVPLLNGEIAATFHHRKVDLKDQSPETPLSSSDVVSEQRYALDGKWDAGIGLWFESVVVCQDVDIPDQRYQLLTDLGFDYTFDLGNGLNMIGEHFMREYSENLFEAAKHDSISAVSVNYPLGLVDNLTAIVNYDWDNHDWYRYINWQRMFDDWSIYFSGFWNPEQNRVANDRIGDEQFSGTGVRVIIVFNH
ncbi:hypothetical protein QUF90_24775 [Desulfococcaceae bacterium HSG9]|nr:hypothetical protein [Desulfococcaceae bacterium HSG9]